MPEFYRFTQTKPAKSETVDTTPIQLANPETDASFEIGRRMSATGEYRDRYDYDQYSILLNAIEAWRVNPMARRAIELTTQFVIGSGIEIKVDGTPEQTFIEAWRDHPVNNITRQLPEWADELWRAGNLIMIGSVDDAGMTYWRPLPAELVSDFETYKNDPYRLKKIVLANIEQDSFPAYRKGSRQRIFVKHYAINRPAGGSLGESDLAPVLRYIRLYTDWLIDRAALNKYLKPVFVVQKSFNSDSAKRDYANSVKPPAPGSTLIADTTEKWGVLPIQLGSFEASQDGLAIKKMIAAGLGFPLHYFAEPESSTRTTAEAAGTPTFRRLQQRQLWFTQILADIVRTTLEVRANFANDVNPTAVIKITAPDISERDNAQMAMSANRIASALLPFFDNLGAEEIIRMIYRFAGETNLPVVDKNARPLARSTPDNADPDPTLPDDTAPENTGSDE